MDLEDKGFFFFSSRPFATLLTNPLLRYIITLPDSRLLSESPGRQWQMENTERVPCVFLKTKQNVSHKRVQ